MQVSGKSRNFARMIQLERHIEILLLSNDCVIVPNLGGFMAHYVEARYDEDDHLFLPPLRTLGFNPQLRLNDHLLVQSYIEAYDISYPEALRRIEDEVAELRQHLFAHGNYELNDIGTLSLNEEGNIVFEPCEAGILTPEIYGLGSFEMLPLALQQDVSEQQKPLQQLEPPVQQKPEDILEFQFPDDGQLEDVESQQPEEDTLTIKLSWVRNVVAMAAAIAAFFFITTPVSNSDMGTGLQQSSMIPISRNEVAHQLQVQEADGATAVAPQKHVEQEDCVDLQKEIQKHFVVVLASQTSPRHANEFTQRLAKEGYGEARTMPMAHTKMVRVVYGAFASEAEAQQQLRSLRTKSPVFAEAWVMSVE